MFKILKRLVKGTPRQETIAFSLLDQWFMQKVKALPLRDELNESFDTISLMLKNIQQSLTHIATTLVQLPNEQRVIVEEHAQKYIATMTHLIRQLKPHETRDFDAILNYHETLAAACDSMKNAKEFSVIQKFYPAEANELQMAIQSLCDIEAEVKEVIKSENGLEYIASIKKKITAIEKKHRKKLELQAAIERENLKKSDAESYKLKLETDADNLKTSEEYEKYDKILSRKIYLENEKERVETSVTSLFEPFVPLFKRYDSMELGADRALARAYADDHLKAFFNDNQLWVLSLLQSVSAKLPDLEQDEKKRMKFRQTIMAITEDSLRQIASKSYAIDESLRDIRHQLSADITARKLEDIKYKMSHAQQQIEHFATSIGEHETGISQLFIEKDLRSLEKDLIPFAQVKIL